MSLTCGTPQARALPTAYFKVCLQYAAPLSAFPIMLQAELEVVLHLTSFEKLRTQQQSKCKLISGLLLS